jgi:hypothetical protein
LEVKKERREGKGKKEGGGKEGQNEEKGVRGRKGKERFNTPCACYCI